MSNLIDGFAESSRFVLVEKVTLNNLGLVMGRDDQMQVDFEYEVGCIFDDNPEIVSRMNETAFNRVKWELNNVL